MISSFLAIVFVPSRPSLVEGTSPTRRAPLQYPPVLSFDGFHAQADDLLRNRRIYIMTLQVTSRFSRTYEFFLNIICIFFFFLNVSRFCENSMLFFCFCLFIYFYFHFLPRHKRLRFFFFFFRLTLVSVSRVLSFTRLTTVTLFPAPDLARFQNGFNVSQ